MGIKNDILWRIYVAFFGVCIIGVMIVWKIFMIQVPQGKYWRAMADSLTTSYRTIPADRGNIYDDGGRLLATSLPTFDIHMDVNADDISDEMFNANVDSLSIGLAAIFKDHTYDDFKQLLETGRRKDERYVLLHRDASYPQLQALRHLPIFRLGQYKGGLIADQTDKRNYPYDELGMRTVGILRQPVTQSVGIEASFDTSLRGIPGKRLVQKIAGGVWLPINDNNEMDPQNGKDIITTLDVNLQDIAENALLNSLVKNNADHGTCIVMDVKTGAIKAMANLGKTGDGTYGEIYNYAIGEAREPGSTFKLASMIAMLEDGLVKITDTVDVELGVKEYYGQTMHDAEHHGFRRVSVMKGFAISSNVGISKLAFQSYESNPNKYLQHLRDLQLDQPTGIEIPGEQKPYIKTTQDKTWSAVSLPWMSVGYELRVTPLRLLTLYNAVANNGKMMKPYIVSEVDEYGKPLHKFKPVILKDSICSQKTLQSVRTLLGDVIAEGTGMKLKNPYYSVAGKTGTAEISDATHHYGEIYQASFCGYFPADHPLYSCIVVVNAPSNGLYYGGEVAAPVFKVIADNVYGAKIDSMHQQKDTTDKKTQFIIAESGSTKDLKKIYDVMNLPLQDVGEAGWISASQDQQQTTAKAIDINDAEVPNVVGMGLKDALFLLEESGLHVVATGKGKVKNQSLFAGAKILKGESITINLN